MRADRNGQVIIHRRGAGRKRQRPAAPAGDTTAPPDVSRDILYMALVSLVPLQTTVVAFWGVGTVRHGVAWCDVGWGGVLISSVLL